MSTQKFKIKRARDYYLYDEQGNRKVDFCLANGTALLGHRFQKIQHTIKNTISKGYLGNSLTQEHIRAKTHLQRLVPNRPLVAILPNSANYDLCKHPFFSNNKVGRIFDLVQDASMLEHLPQQDKTLVLLWRFFSGIDLATFANATTDYLAILLPVPWNNGQVAVYGHTSVAQEEILIDVPVPILSAINYIIPHIISKQRDMPQSVVRPCPNVARHRQDIVILRSEDIEQKKNYAYANLPLAPSWRRQGVYIILPEYHESEYSRIWHIFFEHGFYFPEFQQNTFRVEHTRVPSVLTIPTCMTLHELSSWKQVIKLVAE